MPTPWPLSAPESLVLREGVAGQGTPALKLALLELVARRVIRIEAERRRLGRRTWVMPGTAPALVTGPLAGLGRTCLEQAAGGRKRLDKVVARHLSPHGDSAQRWLERDVVPGLQERGLVAAERRRVLGIVPRTTWHRTAAGDALRADLEGRVTGLRRAVRSTADPRDALALVAAAGAAVLLAQDAWPLVEELRRRAADGGGDGGGGPGPDGGGPDAGDVDVPLGPDLDLDLDLDSVGSAVDGVDAGVDAGGGGGDGGGGGGD